MADIDDTLMRRAVAFAGTIANSKKFADIVTQYLALEEQPDMEPLGDSDSDGDEGGDSGSDNAASNAPLLECEVKHVDGTVNVLERGARLDWLRN